MLRAGVWCQGGWNCHHIDDLHPSEDRLPSLAALREHSVSSLFAAAVTDRGNVMHVEESGNTSYMEESDEVAEAEDEVMEAEDTEQMMTIDDSEPSAQYSKMMETVEPAASVVSAVTNARRKLARRAVQYGRQVMENHSTSDELLDVDTIILNCVHSAMTMLKDKDSCRGRKTSRLQMLLSLLPPEFTEHAGTQCR